MPVKFDSDRPQRCDYCDHPVVDTDLVVISNKNVFLVYHRECDGLARAERAHLYTQFLRELEPRRKETL